MLTIKQLSILRSTGKSFFSVCLPELTVKAGEVVVIQGDSGAGKSTLLEMVGMILKPDEIGHYKLIVDNYAIDIATLIEQNQLDKLADIRAQYLGFMLQTGGLLPFLTVRDNILLSLKLFQSG
jgi:putative ABC transport system ATP-binding protein